ncbi:putative lipid II flippase FtsW [Candidatus Omnitrophota bacterium]
MRHIRISIFMIAVTLICVGLVMVYSSSAIFSLERYRSSTFFLRRHLLHLIVGLILTVFVMNLDLKHLRRWARPLFLFSVILLMLLFVPGLARQVGGARRWLSLGLVSFQPSELVKWTSVLFLADFLVGRQKELSNLAIGKFLSALLIVGAVCALILVQPDLGGALAIAIVAALMFFAARIPLFYIINLALCSLPVLYFSIFSVAYRRKRIITFLNPWADIRGSGFQLVQSYLALGLGGLWGVGLGQSRQKLFYLPAAHTDFVFSIIGEELGLLGTLAIISLFILFLWQGIKVSLRSSDPFIKLFSFGLVITIVFSACVHMAVACGAVPTKGLPLPFISYGGSSLVFNMMGVGLLLNSARDRYLQEQKLGV